MATRKNTLAERFHRNVQRTDDLFSCWEWTGYRMRSGYGQIGAGSRHLGLLRAHRVAWELAYGPIPDGFEVCHACDNPSCVRPDHLFVGTHAANMADRTAKGRDRKKLTPEKVRAIRASNDTQWTLARRYGVNQATIGEVLHRKIWKHVA